MSELILSVVAGSDRLVGFRDTFGSGGDAVFVVTFVTLCVALSLFAVGSWFCSAGCFGLTVRLMGFSCPT